MAQAFYVIGSRSRPHAYRRPPGIGCPRRASAIYFQDHSHGIGLTGRRTSSRGSQYPLGLWRIDRRPFVPRRGSGRPWVCRRVEGS